MIQKSYILVTENKPQERVHFLTLKTVFNKIQLTMSCLNREHYGNQGDLRQMMQRHGKETCDGVDVFLLG